jgi:hypothetical protein
MFFLDIVVLRKPLVVFNARMPLKLKSMTLTIEDCTLPYEKSMEVRSYVVTGHFFWLRLHRHCNYRYLRTF